MKTLHISDGVTTENYVNPHELFRNSAMKFAKYYASTYDHNGEPGWVVCRCFSDDSSKDDVVFAFDDHHGFEWNTDRQFVSH